jgi:hypothetical protein
MKFGTIIIEICEKCVIELKLSIKEVKSILSLLPLP